VFFGRRTPGMTPIAFDEIDLAKRFGLQVVSFGWDEVEAVAHQISPTRVRSVVRRLHGSAGKITSTPESLADSARLYLAIKSMTEKERGIIATLGCYPHYAGRVCVAAGLLNDDGLAASCEGDLNSGIVMHLLQSFTGRPALFGEMLDVNQKDNSIITSHCGSGPTKLAQSARDVQICPVRLFERGAAIRFPAQGGPATYVNLAGCHDNYRMCSVEGKAVPLGMVFEGNPVKFKPDVPVKSVLATVAEKGFGHHWMLGYGWVAQELEYFCKLTGIKSMCLA
jgi:L-fucose isomerase-like protein